MPSEATNVICLEVPPSTTVTIDSPPLWDESLSLAAKGLYAVMCTRYKSGLKNFKNSALAKACATTEYSMRKASRELKEAGYLEVRRLHDEETGRKTGSTAWVLKPYANGVHGEIFDMTPAQSKAAWLERSNHAHAMKSQVGSVKSNIDFTVVETPPVNANIDFTLPTCGNSGFTDAPHTPCWTPENAPSPAVPCCCRGVSSPPGSPGAAINLNHVLYDSDPSIPSEGVPSSVGAERQVQSHPIGRLDEVDEFTEDGLGSAGGTGDPEGRERFARHEEALAKCKGYKPRNCTERQAQGFYAQVERFGGWQDSQYSQDQFWRCLPYIDQVLEPGEHEFADWWGCALRACQVLSPTMESKKYPSYWLADYVGGVRELTASLVRQVEEERRAEDYYSEESIRSRFEGGVRIKPFVEPNTPTRRNGL